MRVPDYEEQVKPSTVQISAPPSPGVVPGAFGADVGRAESQTADVLGDISAHIYKMAQDASEKQILDRETEYRKEMQSVLFDPTPQTLTIGDQEIQRPKGVMNRELSQAAGAIQDYDKTYYTQIREKYLKDLSPYQQGKFSTVMDNYYVGYRDNVIQHEARQMDEDLKNSVESNVGQKIAEAANIDNSDKLSQAILDAQNAYQLYNQRFDPVTQKQDNTEIAEKVVKSAVMSVLLKSGLPQAQDLLDKSKDKITMQGYEDLSNEIDTKAYQINRLRQHELLVNKVNNRFDVMNGIASGKINFANADDLINQVTSTDPDLAESMRSVFNQNAKGKQFRPAYNDRAYAQNIQNLFNTSDQKTLSDSLVQLLRQPNLSKDRMAIIVNAAVNRSKTLPISSDGQDPNGNNSPVFSPRQTAIDAGVKALGDFSIKTGANDIDLYHDYMKEVNSGKDPSEAYQAAIKNFAIRQSPQSVTQDEVANMVMTPEDAVKVIFPKTTTVYPNRIYNPEKKIFELNPQRKKSSKDKIK